MREAWAKNQYLTPVNIVMVLINVVSYFVLEAIGDTTDALFMYTHGAMYPAAVLAGGEYYRLITSAFIHFGLPHLINNMILLICLGSYVERALGKNTISDLISGLRSRKQYGIYVPYDLQRRLGRVGRGFRRGFRYYRSIAFPGGKEPGPDLRIYPGSVLLIMMLLALYFGFATAGVDNAAHVGGLIIGFVMGAIFFLLEKIFSFLRRL